MSRSLITIHLAALVFTIIACHSKEDKRATPGAEFPGFETIESLKEVPYLKPGHQGLQTIPVSEEIFKSPMDVSAVTEHVDVIKLETRKECLIGEIDDIFFDDGKIIIADKRGSQAVMVFDDQGTFMFKISNIGKGPEEFLEIHDVTIDRFNKRIIILDLKGRKLCFFDYGGNFLFNRKMFYLFSEFQVFDSVNFAFFAPGVSNDHVPSINEYALITGNSAGEAFQKSFPILPQDRDFSYYNFNHLRNFNGIIEFYPRFSDTIYQVTKNSIEAKYAIDFGGKGFPKSSIGNMTDEYYQRLSREYPQFYGDYVDLKDFLYLTINFPTQRHHLIFDKRSKHIKGDNAEKLIHRPEDLFFDYPIAGFSDNSLVVVINSVQLTQQKEYILKEHGKTISRQLLDVLGTIEDMDNPVLFIYALKSF